MKTYEIEIKSLLGKSENAQKLKENITKSLPEVKLVAEEKQLNHYFHTPSDLAAFEQSLLHIVPKDKVSSFRDILEHGSKISIRTRDANGKVILVIKASINSDTSSNGVKRIECEIPVDMSLNDLDELVLKAGGSFQAKWSREREEYTDQNIHICIDKNAGYGYVAEFEKVIKDESQAEQTRQELLGMMNDLGVTELSQDRLERMFAHYNEHWQEYYGTDKTFTIE